ncbi:hypothetical protein JCM4914_31920 [Streptomyces platensis subsp. malvinus]
MGPLRSLNRQAGAGIPYTGGNDDQAPRRDTDNARDTTKRSATVSNTRGATARYVRGTAQRSGPARHRHGAAAEYGELMALARKRN